MPEFGRNGTYLVFRQLEQDVSRFWNYLQGATRDASGNSLPADQEKLGAKIVGRWSSGAPLTLNPHSDPAAPDGVDQHNNFSYADKDPDGFGCPVGAHIRRTNPRDSLFDNPAVSLKTVNRHRIIRRGRSYGHKIVDACTSTTKKNAACTLFA